MTNPIRPGAWTDRNLAAEVRDFLQAASQILAPNYVSVLNEAAKRLLGCRHARHYDTWYCFDSACPNFWQKFEEKTGLGTP